MAMAPDGPCPHESCLPPWLWTGRHGSHPLSGFPPGGPGKPARKTAQVGQRSRDGLGQSPTVRKHHIFFIFLKWGYHDILHKYVNLLDRPKKVKSVLDER